MSGESPTARLANIRLHPIKGLDPVGVSEARIGPNGGLELDRVWVLFTIDGKWINGKNNPEVHRVRAAFDPQVRSVELRAETSAPPKPVKLQFPGDVARAAEWFSECFGRAVVVRHIPEGVPDDGLASGPTIVSTASLEAVCGLYPGMPLAEARERFRTTLEIDGVPAFWEDRLFGADENYAVRFKIGEVAFEGSNPCARCPVPPRNPRTGEILAGFQKKFAAMRRDELPEASPRERFDHFYRLATNTRVASTEQGKRLRVGDAVIL